MRPAAIHVISQSLVTDFRARVRHELGFVTSSGVAQAQRPGTVDDAALRDSAQSEGFRRYPGSSYAPVSRFRLAAPVADIS
jgi:hypothetical protein